MTTTVEVLPVARPALSEMDYASRERWLQENVKPAPEPPEQCAICSQSNVFFFGLNICLHCIVTYDRPTQDMIRAEAEQLAAWLGPAQSMLESIGSDDPRFRSGVRKWQLKLKRLEQIEILLNNVQVW